MKVSGPSYVLVDKEGWKGVLEWSSLITVCGTSCCTIPLLSHSITFQVPLSSEARGWGRVQA